MSDQPDQPNTLTRDTQPLLTLRDLSLSYRARPALCGLNWTVNPGEQWAVLGPNAAGKTSLAAVISGEQRHYSGALEYAPSLASSGIAYVCFEQARTLLERDRKLDVSEFNADASDPGTRVMDLLPKTECAERRQWVRLLGIEAILERGLRLLSTGELRKALLAGAILRRPGLLILDSPLDGIDAASQQALHTALDALLHSGQPTLLLARALEDVPAACSHVLLLESGRVRNAGPREQVLSDAATRSLMQPAMPTLGALPAPATRAYTLDPTAPLLELRGVSAHFGGTLVLHDVHWRFEQGQHCCISGPNGCGKTTLLGLLTGDNHKAYGQPVYLFGRRRGSGESVWDIRQKFGLIDTRLQLGFARGMQVLEVVVSGFFDSVGLYDQWGESQRTLALAWLKALGIDALAQQPFDTLSFGLQRMVLLARAMVKSPKILVLDEPTLGLDAHHRSRLLRALEHIAAHSDTQLLFVSHTAADMPACINQHLRFVADTARGASGFRVEVSNTPDGATAPGTTAARV